MMCRASISSFGSQINFFHIFYRFLLCKVLTNNNNFLLIYVTFSLHGSQVKVIQTFWVISMYIKLKVLFGISVCLQKENCHM